MSGTNLLGILILYLYTHQSAVYTWKLKSTHILRYQKLYWRSTVKGIFCPCMICRAVHRLHIKCSYLPVLVILLIIIIFNQINSQLGICFQFTVPLQTYTCRMHEEWKKHVNPASIPCVAHVYHSPCIYSTSVDWFYTLLPRRQTLQNALDGIRILGFPWVFPILGPCDVWWEYECYVWCLNTPGRGGFHMWYNTPQLYGSHFHHRR